jgi:hypothetical protein
VAQNLTKRLDRIERLIKEKLSTDQGPIYLLEHETIPEGREAIRIVMQWVKASQLGDDVDSLGASVGHRLSDPDSAPRKDTLTHPPSAKAAEREKRWLECSMHVAARH